MDVESTFDLYEKPCRDSHDAMRGKMGAYSALHNDNNEDLPHSPPCHLYLIVLDCR